MDIGILGPLVVGASDRDAAPSAPKPRQLLALLAVRAGRVVPVDLLVEELWESSPPPSALTTVQTYIVLLRRLLAKCLRVSSAAVAQEVLTYTGWGYQLSADEGTHDATDFARHAALGRRALAEGDNGRASAALREALARWRGPALVDVRTGPHLLAHQVSLEEQRMGTVEQRIEADLRLGRHHEVIGELSGLVVQHPLHENIHSLLMVALYRSGRPGQALATFQQLHQNLRDELGMEPSPRIRTVQQGILRRDSSLEAVEESKLFLQQLTAPSRPAG
ncbi:putative transcriptional regulator [Actinacidiphila reveromycinica]|uniref:Putative transcriptional regulator n=1 Tax=Actinacidiphila reveromycinica TaxID=659352 RepID=G1UDT7_9ACTN|nr:AfsR/SARP family transcriptional regulator [Streptomyces sp. SN-593]BAK64633.1 putative transcriptional regulator [Streptomyces sp. SN-593]BBB01290.1 putative transcriptional regulator [Streptomyces sp. SN-593]